MNRIYKVIWNEALSCFTAVGEYAKGRGKSSKSSVSSNATINTTSNLSVIHTLRLSTIALGLLAAGFGMQANADLNYTNKTHYTSHQTMGNGHSSHGNGNGVGHDTHGNGNGYGHNGNNGNNHLSGLKFTGDTGGVITRNHGEKLNVKGGATGTLTTGNIGVVADGYNTLNIQLAKDIDLGGTGSITTGNAVMNDRGITFFGGSDVSLSDTGLNNGGNQIKGVDAGSDGTDAVNVNQLYKAVISNKTKYYSVNSNGGANVQNEGATGQNAMAMGKNAEAKGSQAIAIGSVSGGQHTIANGEQSIAIGANVVSTGGSSIAIGGNDLDDASKVNGVNALFNTYTGITGGLVTVGDYSNHTESGGAASVAIGVKAHSKGNLSTAVGVRSSSSGDASSAFGMGSSATKKGSVALGAGSTTFTDATYQDKLTIGSKDYLYAGETNDKGAQISVGSEGRERQIKHVASGEVSAASTDAINGSQLHATNESVKDLSTTVVANKTHFYSVNSTDSTRGNYNNNGATGVDAMAAGIDAQAVGNRAVAMGTGASATSSESTALGAASQAFAASATAVGFGARADKYGTTAMGVNSRAQGEYSTAVGQQAEATGDDSIAMAKGAKATKKSATAVGVNAKAEGERSVALGEGAQATTLTGTAIGSRTLASAVQSTAVGVGSHATKQWATSVGFSSEAKGISSVALGDRSVVDGKESIAIGKGNIVSGKNSVAVGTGHTISGDNSGAFGDPNIISGTGSYAVGNNNTIDADNSFVLGNNVTINASDKHSIALGEGAVINGEDSIAIGRGATAAASTRNGLAIGVRSSSGNHAASLGDDATSGNYAVALGSKSTAQIGGTAIGRDSSAVSNATALGREAIAGQSGNVALGHQSITALQHIGAFAINNQPVAGLTSGANTVSVGTVGAERQIQNVAPGIVDATSTDAINGSQLHATNSAIGDLSDTVVANKTHYYSVNDSNVQQDNYNNDGAIGSDAMAAGARALATGERSTALGNGASALGNDSTATGRNAKAAGLQSTVAGAGSEAGVRGTATGYGAKAVGNSRSTATGYLANASGDRSTAIGSDTTAKYYATALGNASSAEGSFSTALGNKAKAEGKSSVAIGDKSLATKESNIALGDNAQATGNQSIAQGRNTKATGSQSIAQGTHAEATGNYSSAQGYFAKATQSGAIAQGRDAKAFGENSIAQGIKATASGKSSVAIGDGSKASGVNSIAIGTGNEVTGDNSGAFGDPNIISGSGSYAVGNNNTIDADNSFVLGNNVKINASDKHSIALGEGAVINGEDSIAIGRGATAAASTRNGLAIGVRSSSGNHAASLGDDATSGNYAVALGSKSTAQIGGTAIGRDSSAVSNATALGREAIAGQSGNVALGHQSITALQHIGAFAINNQPVAGLTSGANTVSVGTVGAERQIQNVAPGIVDATSTDAINGSQLHATNSAIGDLSDTVVANKTHYYSVNDSNVQQDNYNNDGAIGSDAMAAGARALATGERSTALGNGASALGNDSTATGRNAKAAGLQSTVAGAGSEAGVRGTATGYGAKAVGNSRSTATGYLANASGDRSTAIGSDTTAKYYATALGNASSAEGSFSTALGNKAKAEGKSSVAIGDKSLATKESNIALGDNAQATGNQSIAQGRNTKATGSQSIAQGTHAEATGNYSSAQGYFAKATQSGAIAQGRDAKAFGENSIAQGIKATASGKSSVAIGDGSKASGVNSIAIGTGNEVTGDNSGAFGDPNIISGSGSYAVGNNNTIDADNSFVLGNNVKINASDKHSIALGEGAVINGEDSIAIGRGATAAASTRNGLAIGVRSSSGNHAASLGDDATSGNYAVALGSKSTAQIGGTAIGRDSSAVSNATALGREAIAGQSGNVALGHQSITALQHIGAFAINNQPVAGLTSGANTVSVGTVGAERQIQNVAPGIVDATSTDAINGSQLHATNSAIGDLSDTVVANKTHYYSVNDSNVQQDNYNNDGAIGSDAMAAGARALATGERSTALGNGASALGNDSTATGRNAKAAGLQSTVAGAGSEAGVRGTATGYGAKAVGNSRSTATGYLANASGDRSTAIGSDTTAKYYATALGNASSAEGSFSTALGNKAKAEGKSSVAIGDKSLATKESNIALGDNAQATGNQSIAQGRNTKATGSQSIAQGTHAEATGNYSSAQGYFAKATQSGAIAQGRDAKAFGENSIAQGIKATASGKSSVAIGDGSKASGVNSIAIGTGNEVTGDNSGAFGDPNIISGSGSYAVGNNNTIDADNSFVLGNNVKINASDKHSIALGEGAVINGEDSIAIGRGATAAASTRNGLAIGVRSSSGNHAASLGDDATSGNYAVALGSKSTAQIGGTAIGRDSSAVSNATALGREAIAGQSGNVALGHQSITALQHIGAFAINNQPVAGLTSGANTVSVGTVGAERQIQNVAPGIVDATSTDAINGSQLHATNKAIGDLSGTVIANKTKYYSVKSGATGNKNNDGAQGPNSMAMGGNASATGGQAIAIGSGESGQNTVASGQQSIAIGANTVSKGHSSIAIGGDDLDAASMVSGVNALFNTYTGSTGGLVTVGDYNNHTESNGAASIAIGVKAHSKGNLSTAVGVRSSSLGDASSAFGMGSSASKKGSVALGAGSVANRAGGLAGYIPTGVSLADADAITNTQSGAISGAVSVGSGAKGGNRQIINLAAGTNDSDAVNVAQLKGGISSVIDLGLDFTGDNTATTVTRNLGEKLAVKGGATTALSDNNIGVVADDTSKTLTVKLAKKLTSLESITINNGGPIISSTGIDMGSNADEEDYPTNTITNLGKGVNGTDAVNLDQLNDVTTDLTDLGFDITADNASLAPGETKDKVKLGDTVKYTSADGSIVTTVADNEIDFALGDNLSVGGPGLDGEDGVDGFIGVNGADGASGVAINGADGTIGLTGPAGAGTIGVINGVPGVNGEDGITRIVIDDIQVATMEDGMKFAGNTGATIAKQLNETLNIEGTLANSADASGANLRVDSDNGKLNLMMAKNLTDLDSIMINNGGPIISSTGIDMGSNADEEGYPTNTITNLGKGVNGTDAVNLDQLNDVTTDLTDLGFDITADNASLAPGETKYKVKLGETVKYTSADGSIVTTVADNEIDFALGDNLNVGGPGLDGEDGVDGFIGVNGADGQSGIALNGADGTIGLTGPAAIDGVSPTLTMRPEIRPGDVFDDDTDVTRLSYEDGDGNSHTIATLEDDGLRFSGNDNPTVGYVTRNLNKEMQIVGSKTAIGTYSSGNINTIATQDGGIEIQMADSPKFGEVIINAEDTGKITGLAAGEDDTDAVNVYQLNQTNSTINQGLDFGGDSGTDVNRKLGQKLTVKGGDTINADPATKNISVTANGTDTLTIRLDKDINLGNTGSVTTGNTQVNNAGITLYNGDNNQVALTNNGLNNGKNKITNVADGFLSATSKDAVNGSQLFKTNNEIAKGIKIGDGNSANDQQFSLGDTINVTGDNNLTTVASATGVQVKLNNQLDLGDDGSIQIGNSIMSDAGFTFVGNGVNRMVSQVSLSSRGLDNGGNTIRNVGEGVLNTDAVNVGQLKDVAIALDQGWGITAQGDIATMVKQGDAVDLSSKDGNIKVSRKSVSDVAALNGSPSLQAAAIPTNANDISFDLNPDITLNSVTTGDTVMNDNGLTIAGGPSITKSGIDAANTKITNVQNGEVSATSQDAINGGQLYAQGTGISSIIGGDTVYNAEDGTFTNSDIGGTGESNIDGAIASIRQGTIEISENVQINTESITTNTTNIATNTTNIATNTSNITTNTTNIETNTDKLNAGLNFGADSGANINKPIGDDSVLSFTGGNNITTTADGSSIKFDLNGNISVDSVTVGTTVINSEGISIQDGPSMTSQGLYAGNQRMTGVADGVEATDAVNYSQLSALDSRLNNNMSDLGYKIDEVEDDANAGISAAMAMSAMPQAYIAGKSLIGGGVGTYNGESAVAIGFSKLSNDGRWVIKVNGTADTQGNVGGAVGAGFHFD